MQLLSERRPRASAAVAVNSAVLVNSAFFLPTLLHRGLTAVEVSGPECSPGPVKAKTIHGKDVSSLAAFLHSVTQEDLKKREKTESVSGSCMAGSSGA